MALHYVKEEHDESNHVVATERLCLTEDRKRLVPENTREARWLFCTPGSRITREDAARYGLLGKDDESETAEDSEEKSRSKTEDKRRGKSADKGKGNGK